LEPFIIFLRVRRNSVITYSSRNSIFFQLGLDAEVNEHALSAALKSWRSLRLPVNSFKKTKVFLGIFLQELEPDTTRKP